MHFYFYFVLNFLNFQLVIEFPFKSLCLNWLSCNALERLSVTRWLDYIFIFGHENLPNSIQNLPIRVQNFAKYFKNRQKWPTSFKIWPKWQNFPKSGHTVESANRPSLSYCFLLLLCFAKSLVFVCTFKMCIGW